ncbi:hypothetical protein HanRHA438_Chr17g0823541 [Helianthus annuus]|nr:hypothetical protein HanRHA438_Chr17g0823541 [Helianthus annuus]
MCDKNRTKVKPRWISPNDPLPILRPSMYFPPTILYIRFSDQLRRIDDNDETGAGQFGVDKNERIIGVDNNEVDF